MKKPLRRNTEIDMNRVSRWRSEFSGYRHEITEGRIERWLAQFYQRDRDIAARILDCVDFITHGQMVNSFRSILDSLPGWSRDNKCRRGKWRFVAYSTSAGQSGDTMLHVFRWANELNSREYDALFVYKSELLGEDLGRGDTVVFVDDFAGTGIQACEAWEDHIQELLPGNPCAFLLLVAASVAARKEIEERTGLTVGHNVDLTAKDNIFSPKCGHFTPSEKKTILKYCRKADRRRPKGFGDCGFVIVFAHRCPNNTIPILHVYHSQWEGLFRRYD